MNILSENLDRVLDRYVMDVRPTVQEFISFFNMNGGIPVLIDSQSEVNLCDLAQEYGAKYYDLAAVQQGDYESFANSLFDHSAFMFDNIDMIPDIAERENFEELIRFSLKNEDDYPLPDGRLINFSERQIGARCSEYPTYLLGKSTAAVVLRIPLHGKGDDVVKLEGMIDYAYKLFCNQVEGGIIKIDNEASMQLHLSNILLQLGRLNVFTKHEYFNIELEKYISLDTPTSKSQDKARVDIWVEFVDGEERACAAIELKYLKKMPGAAVTDSRYSVYQDLENLEHYAAIHNSQNRKNPLYICEIVCSNNSNFMEDKGLKYSIADNTVITPDSANAAVRLSNRYTVAWDKFSKFNFVKLTPD